MEGQIIKGRYNVIEKIGEGGMSFVYKAVDSQSPNGQEVAIKVLKPSLKYKGLESLFRFQQEASTMAKLSHPNIIKFYEVGQEGELNYIVMELINGETLSNVLKKREKLNVDEARNIVIQIANALDYTHKLGIIHRDIKPSNVMVVKDGNQLLVGSNQLAVGNNESAIRNPQSTIKLMDFGLARLIDFSEWEAIGSVIGTFNYMAPEQTGQLSQPVDARSDLYSLGILFYELLIGNPPFYGNDVGAIIHYHIAKKPKPLTQIDKNIPIVLERIILKLLSKDPADRYQTAFGLVSDLEKFQELTEVYEKTGKILLGAKDQRGKILSHIQLIGRDKELSLLLNNLRLAREKQGSIVVIRGETGIGKTRLTEDIANYLQTKQGLFIQSRCYKGGMPYQPITDLFAQYIERLKTFPKEKREKAEKVIRDSIGELGSVLIKIAPSFKEILGEIKEAVELEAEQERFRLFQIVSTLLNTLGSIEKPLVVFIDDIHNVSQEAIGLLKHIFLNLRGSKILFICAYTEEELKPEHSLRKLISELINQENELVNEIALKELNIIDTKTMISVMLEGSDKVAEQIGEYIYNETGGNPLFINEMVRLLADEQILVYSTDGWTCDESKLKTVSISGNLEKLVQKRMHRLSQDSLDIFSVASAFGKTFEFDMLHSLVNIRTEKLLGIIDEGVDIQLIKEKERGVYYFVYEAPRLFLYERNTEEDKIRLHREIGYLIERKYQGNIEPVIHELAYHFQMSNEKDKIVKYSILAGDMAMKSFGYDKASNFYESALKCWTGEKDANWLDITNKLGECYSYWGKYDEAIDKFNQALSYIQKTNDKLAESSMELKIGNVYWKKGDFKKALQHQERALIVIGRHPPKLGLPFYLRFFWNIIVQVMHTAFPKLFVVEKERPSKDPNKVLALKIYKALTETYYYEGVMVKPAFSQIVQLNIVETLGDMKKMANAYAYHGLVCAFLSLFDRAVTYGKKAISIAESINNAYSSAEANFFTGHAHFFMSRYDESLKYLDEAVKFNEKAGDMWIRTVTIRTRIRVLVHQGEFRKALRYINENMQLGERIGDKATLLQSHYFLGYTYIALGEWDKAPEELQKAIDLSVETNYPWGAVESVIFWGILLQQQQKWDEAIEKYNQYMSSLKKITYKFDISRYHSGLAESMMGDKKKIKEMPQKEREILLNKVKPIVEKALHSSKRCGKLYKAISYRAFGTYQYLRGNYKIAEKYLQLALTFLTDIGARYELGLTYLEIGRLYNLDDQMRALHYLQMARSIFFELGTNKNLEMVDAMLGKHIEVIRTEHSTDSSVSVSTTDSSVFTHHEGRTRSAEVDSSALIASKRELLTVIQISYNISSVSNFDELLVKIMDSVIEVMKAERGFLFLYDPEYEGLVVKVARNIDKENIMAHSQEFSHHIVEDVAITGKPRLVMDAQTDPVLKLYDSVIAYNLRSILCVPLKVQDKIIGVIYVDNRLVSNLFTKHDMELLNTLATQSAISIENTRLYQKAKESNENLQALHEAGLMMSALSIVDVDKLFSVIVKFACKFANAEKGSLMLLDKNTNELVIKAIEGEDRYSLLNQRYKLNGNLVSEVIRDRKPLLVKDVNKEAKLDLKRSSQYSTESFIIVPLLVQDKVLGVISVTDKKTGKYFTDDDLTLLTAFASAVSVNLENATLYKNLAENERLQQELKIASDIQTTLLPKEMPQNKDLDVYGLMQPAKEVGGDYFDFVQSDKDPDNLTICIGDVSGKGVSAGLIMMIVRSYIHSLTPICKSTVEIVSKINHLIMGDIGSAKFMSLLLLNWDSKNKKFIYTPAGHERIIVYRKETGKCEEFKSGGLALGIEDEFPYEENELFLNPGDAFVLYTDGVTEANNSNKDMFTRQRLISAVEKYGDKSPKEILDSIYSELEAFIGDCEQYDDITLVAVKRK